METEGTVEGTREESRINIIIKAYLAELLLWYYTELLVQIWDGKMPEDTSKISCSYFLIRAQKIVGNIGME
jgi:hypothetical protein